MRKISVNKPQNNRKDDLIEALLASDQALNHKIMQIFKACLDRQGKDFKDKIEQVKKDRITNI